MIVGLTGNIACGKSLVSQYLKQKNIPLVDADVIARIVVEPGTSGLQQLVEVFGEEILAANGELDRRKLGQMVFASEEKRNQLDTILAPLIMEKVKQQLAYYKDQPLVVVDIPLLFEQPEYLKLVDQVWLVIAEEEQQLERLVKRNGYEEQEALNRIKAQMPIAQKLPSADVLIDNRGSKAETLAQVEQLLETI